MAVTALKIRGPIHGVAGYERHTREFLRELHQMGIAIELGHVQGWLEQPVRDGIVESSLASLTAARDAAINLQFCMPHQVDLRHGRITVNHTMFESSRIPILWRSIAAKVDWTIVPTAFSRDAWIATGAPPERLHVCPLGVRGEQFSGVHEPWPTPLVRGRPLASYRTRMLNISAVSHRKNLDGLLRVWLSATRADDDAVLTLKLSHHGMDAYVREPSLIITAAEDATGRSRAGAAPILVIQETLLDREMPRIYATSSHYISMSHGEGWDMPMMEAIASGLIPIAPDHSAYPTYLDPAIALMIPSLEVPVSTPNPGLFRGLTWWNPDERIAAELIRDVIDDNRMPPASGRDRIIGEYTWRRAAERLVEILEFAHLVSPVKPAR